MRLASWSRTVPMRLDAEPSPCCSWVSSGVARAPLAFSSSPPVDSSDCAPPASASSCGCTAATPLLAWPSAAASCCSPPCDSAQARRHQAPGAVGELLHDVGELARLAHRGVDLPARDLGQRQLCRQRGIEPAVAAGLGGLQAAARSAARDGRERRADVRARLLHRRVLRRRRARAVERRERVLKLARAGLGRDAQHAQARLGVAQRVLPVTIAGTSESTRLLDLAERAREQLRLAAERLRAAGELMRAVLRRRQARAQAVDVAGVAAGGREQAAAVVEQAPARTAGRAPTSSACRRASLRARLSWRERAVSSFSADTRSLARLADLLGRAAHAGGRVGDQPGPGDRLDQRQARDRAFELGDLLQPARVEQRAVGRRERDVDLRAEAAPRAARRRRPARRCSWAARAGPAASSRCRAPAQRRPAAARRAGRPPAPRGRLTRATIRAISAAVLGGRARRTASG